MHQIIWKLFEVAFSFISTIAVKAPAAERKYNNFTLHSATEFIFKFWSFKTGCELIIRQKLSQ